MIKLKFKNRDSEIEFFKSINYWSRYFKIRYAEMISDLDVAENEHELQCSNVDPHRAE